MERKASGLSNNQGTPKPAPSPEPRRARPPFDHDKDDLPAPKVAKSEGGDSPVRVHLTFFSLCLG